MRYRTPRSHPANCRLPRQTLLARLGLRTSLSLKHWRVALAAGLLLLAVLGGVAWRLTGQELARLAQADTTTLSPAHQQMLVLRIATLSDELRFGGHAVEAPLRTAAAALDRAHTTLLRKATADSRQAPDFIALYHGGPQSLDRAMQGFLTATRRFLVARDTEAGELAYHRLQALAEGTLPLRLNQLTDLIDARIAHQQLRLQRLQLAAACIGLAALLLAALIGLRLWRQTATAPAAPQVLPQSPLTIVTIDGVRCEVGRALPVPSAGLRVARS